MKQDFLNVVNPEYPYIRWNKKRTTKPHRW